MSGVIGIIAALPGESKAVAGRGGWRMEDGWPVCRSHPAERQGWTVVRSGPGFRSALRAARWLAQRQPALLVSSGVAGGLAPELAPGDLVLAEDVLGPGKLRWRADPHWRIAMAEALKGQFPCLASGPVVTATRPALTPLVKKSLHLRTNALTVDMESAAIALAASEAQLPFVALRTVCDPAARHLPPELTQLLQPDGGVPFGELACALLRKGSLTKDCWQLFRDYSAALSLLRQAWGYLLKESRVSFPQEALSRAGEWRGTGISS